MAILAQWHEADTMKQAQLESLARKFVEVAHSAKNLVDFEKTIFSVLSEPIGFSTAFWLRFPPGGPPVGYGSASIVYERFFQHFLQNFSRMVAGLMKSQEAAARLGGVFADHQVFSAEERRRLPYYTELMRPQGFVSQLQVTLSVGERTYATIFLNRGRGEKIFDQHSIEAMRYLRPHLSVAYAASAASRRQPIDDGLTKREAQVVSYVAEGFSLANVGALLGTSPNTVRNQIGKVYRKLGVSNRSELVAMWASRGVGTVDPGVSLAEFAARTSRLH